MIKVYPKISRKLKWIHCTNFARYLWTSHDQMYNIHNSALRFPVHRQKSSDWDTAYFFTFHKCTVELQSILYTQVDVKINFFLFHTLCCKYHTFSVSKVERNRFVRLLIWAFNINPVCWCWFILFLYLLRGLWKTAN